MSAVDDIALRPQISLRLGLRTLLGLMPSKTRRAVRWSLIWAVCLAGMDFVSLFMLYPVFAYLMQGGDTALTVPMLGWQIDRSTAKYIAVAALGLMILRSLLSLVYRRWWLSVTANAELELSNDLLRSYAYAPYAFHLNSNSAELLPRAVQNVYIACQSGLVGLVGMASATLLIVGVGGALIVVSPTVGIIVIAYICLLAGIYVLVTRGLLRRLSQELERRISRVYTTASTLLRGIREITVFGLREQYLAYSSDRRRDMTKTFARLALLQDTPKVFLEVTLYLSSLIGIGLLLSSDNPDQVMPIAALYVVAAMRMLPSLAQLLAGVSQLRTGTQIATSLHGEIERIEGMRPSMPNHVPISARRAPLSTHRLSYRYAPGLPEVVQAIDLNVPFGSSLGIVGTSGSGKTTLLSLLMGLLDPSGGTIQYGDDRLVANDSEWFARIAILPQDVFITEESLRANILAGQEFDSDLMAEALELSGLDALVVELPEGIDTELLEGGARLSAGQRQRVGLARALYRQPEVLFLDEPTSALDASTESHIVESIRTLSGRMTVVAVAHRLQTLNDFDHVMELSQGRVVAEGKPSDVLPASRLASRQGAGYEPTRTRPELDSPAAALAPPESHLR